MPRIIKHTDKVLVERCESYWLSLRHVNSYLPGIEIFKNPSKSDLLKMLRQTSTIRGFADHEDVIVWNGEEEIHGTIKKAIRQKYGDDTFSDGKHRIARFQVFRDKNNLLGFEDNDGPDTDEVTNELKQTLLSNPNFTRLFSKEEILNAQSHHIIDDEE